jgi:hypothetical protein
VIAKRRHRFLTYAEIRDSMGAIPKRQEGFHMISVAVTPEVTLDLENRVALRLYRRLADLLGDNATHDGGTDVLAGGHPAWDRHSGGAGHDGTEWTAPDRELAEAFYLALRGKAKVFFDLLLDRPGQQLSVDDLVAASGGAFTSSFSIAGAINGLRKPHQASGRRYPFYWWEGTPTRYAVKPEVAALFSAARSKAAS